MKVPASDPKKARIRVKAFEPYSLRILKNFSLFSSVINYPLIYSEIVQGEPVIPLCLPVEIVQVPS